MKRTIRVRKHRRKGKIIRAHTRKIKKNYGFFGKKKYNPDDYLDLDNPELKTRSDLLDSDLTYGRVSNVSGEKVGRGVTASGIIVPVVLPAPLMAAIGTGISKKVDKVKLIHTDEHDKPYRIPRIEIHGKKKNYGMAWDLNKKTGYPLADYPESFGKKGKLEYVDPKLFIEGVRGQYDNTDSFDEFIAAKKKYGGDESDTTVEEFKKLIRSKEKILPPTVMEYKKGKPAFFEGAHRAIAAYELGEKLPAKVIREK